MDAGKMLGPTSGHDEGNTRAIVTIMLTAAVILVICLIVVAAAVWEITEYPPLVNTLVTALVSAWMLTLGFYFGKRSGEGA